MILIGVPACAVELRGATHHSSPGRYAAAVRDACGAVPVMIPPIGPDAVAVLDRLDGLLLPGSPSNVHPDLYGAPDETPGQHDPLRDGTTFPLIHAALRRGMPLLGIRRGLQGLNLARGRSLHQRVHTLPGREDHTGGDGPRPQRYAPRHELRVSEALRAMLGDGPVRVNSVHGQAVDRLGGGLAVEATAPDGTVEAVRVRGAAGFAWAVQWHPEWDCLNNTRSMALFQAFGAACRAYAGGTEWQAAAPGPAGQRTHHRHGVRVAGPRNTWPHAGAEW